jgi:sterol desaturase/sphingolipid hydroxylase (fatty acid hydroxylase superfamily)
VKAPFAYWVDFLLYPVAACAALYWSGFSAATFAWAGFGFLLFTFLEYWIHRVVLHKFFYHGVHERHHLYPEEYVVFPFWYVPAIFLAFFVVLPLPVFGGFTLGYFWFIAWHDSLHHWNLENHPLIARYAKWHMVHHRRAGYNFGITTPIWDFIFLTYKRS